MSNDLAKKIRIMTDLIMPHNKWYRDNAIYVLKNIDDFNIPKLVEKTIAKLGNHKVVDGHGFDLSDGSEIKTTSIVKNRLEISSVVSTTGALKKGALRVVVYNSATDSIEYYFLPKTFWSTLKRSKNVQNRERIFVSYSYENDVFSSI